MSSEAVFYALGGILVASALVLAFTGLRREGSFPSRSMLIGVTALFAAVVAATMTASVLLAEDEQEHREAEFAEHEEEAAAEAEAPASGGNVLDVTSPEDGSLVFEPDGLEAAPGEVTLVYGNPSPVPHSIAIESEGQQLAATGTVTQGKVELKQKLSPGEYVFYCTVPGHREGGMEGDLTVTGPEEP
jgi:plastocyanin